MLLSHIRQQALLDPEGFVASSEESFREKISALTSAIFAGAAERPFLLLSGPSGSGKTTTAHTLADRLSAMGLETHIISLDNYFRTFSPEDLALFEENRLDLESPDRVDGELLSSHLTALTRGESVRLPYYDFATNTQIPGERILRLHPGELLIFEGIHALNPSVVQSADEYIMGLYVSVRTRIEHDGGQLLHPSKVRLARRLIRDRRERARTYEDVISLYESVERGENLYIMPYKHRADFDMDTFVPYELCVYRSLLPDTLPEEEAKHPWLTELFQVLRQLPSLPVSAVPEDALIREFTGRA